MPDSEIVVRPLKQDDFNDVVRIDREYFGVERADYFARRFTKALESTDHVAISLVAELEGRIAGFIIGELNRGEFGVPENTVCIDSLGVDPHHEHRGVGRAMIEDFVRNARIAGVERLYTRVMWNDLALLRFFDSLGFVPARMINLELEIGSR